MPTLILNKAQEAELARLAEFERTRFADQAWPAQPCLFPYRPDNRLQCELIALGALATSQRRGANGTSITVVTITQDGYQYLEEKAAYNEAMRAQRRHDYILVLMSGLFAMLCTLIGVIIGTTL